MAHVAQHKKETVKEFTKLIDEYPIIGVVNMQNLPTKQLQIMREKLRGKVLLRMTKRRLINIAINDSKKPHIDKLKEYLNGMPAILFTKENPFSLFSTIKKNKSKAPIGAGQTAPNDIVIPAGKTSFAPGPVIGELGSFGIMTAVEDGKIAIKEDKVVAKEGEVVDAKLAGILQRLGVEPMEIGLDLKAVYEKGEILTKDVLDVDEDAYRKDFQSAAVMAFNLAINAGYPTTETVTLLIQKAAADSKALALECDILTDETVGTLLAKAEGEASVLNSKLDIKAPVEETKEEIKEEKVEEPKEEMKKEAKEEIKEEPAKEEEKVEEKKEEEITPEAEVSETKVSDDAQKPEEVSDKPAKEETKEEEKVEEEKDETKEDKTDAQEADASKNNEKDSKES
ncbi:50S ribosomal protein L10 [Candidatus Woesearchaeota archaeon]|nr:50S ribosomal protein L10 [Candidatus Woesearchaeota archaeon]